MLTISGNPENPPVFMLHGLMSNRGVWDTTIKYLEKEYYCIAVDLLGFGDSDKPQGKNYSVSNQGERILSLADSLGYMRFSVIGHSMGGQIALCLATKLAPERIEKLICVSAVVTGILSRKFESHLLRPLALFGHSPKFYRIIQKLLNNKTIVKLLGSYIFFDVEQLPIALIEQTLRIALNMETCFSTAQSIEAIYQFDSSQYLSGVTASALFISGRNDDVVPVDQSILANSLVANSQLAIIENCGHFPMFENTDKYFDTLDRVFLKDGLASRM